MKLVRAIGKKELFFISINAIMGTGIFFLPALGAVQSGFMSIYAWILMAGVAVLISTYFADLVRMFPKSGGVYEYSRKAFGEFFGFIVGWVSWLISIITISMLISGSIRYLFPFFQMIEIILLSVFFILLFNFVSYRGAKFSGNILSIFGILTILTILFVILAGMFNFTFPTIPAVSVISVPLLLVTVYFISETFFGWETATYMTEEVKDGKRIVPKVLVYSTIAIAIMSILFVLVSLGVGNVSEFSSSVAPMLYTLSTIFSNDIVSIFAILIFIPLIGTAANWIVASPRLLYAMSRDGVISPRLKFIHNKYRTPSEAIKFQTMFTILITIISFGAFENLLALLIPLVLITYSIAMFCYIKLAKDIKWAVFGKPGAWFVIFFNIVLVYMWLSFVDNALYTLLMGASLILLGIPMYILVKLTTDKNFIEKFFDSVSFLWDGLFSIWYKDADRKAVVSKLKLTKKSKVLDFGSGSGLTLLEISKKVQDGMVVALDLSTNQLKRGFEKIKQQDLRNVVFIKNKDIDFGSVKFDAIVGVGILEHLNDVEEEMLHVFNNLKKGGRFSFLTISMRGVPLPLFLDKDSLKRTFSILGADVKIKVEKKRMAEFWHIWGTKN